MYGKCSSIDDAQMLFNNLAEREAATWNTLIVAFVAHGKDAKALCIFNQMHQEGMTAEKATFVSVLGALGGEVALIEGKRMHAYIAACGYLSDKVVTTALFGMYGSCGSMKDAEDLFEGMVERTIISWNAMLSEHLHNKCGEKAFQVFDRMLWEGQAPDKVTYLNMLLACTLEETFLGGSIMHVLIKSNDYESEVAVATALIAMYAKFENLERTRRLFDSISKRNIISWNCIVRAYAQCGLSKKVFHLLEQLKQEGSLPNEATLTLSLFACCDETQIFMGKQLHVCISSEKLESDLLLSNALAIMYAKCGRLKDAITFSDNMSQKDVIIWNNLIEACAQKGLETLAFQVLDQMRQENVLMNAFTFIAILEVCCSVTNVRRCQELHVCIAHGDLQEDTTVASALLKTYGVYGKVMQAWTIFDCVLNKDAVLWNTIMSVYAHQGHSVLILQLYAQMLQEGQLPTNITYVSLFSACTNSVFLHEGMRLHCCIRHSKFELDISLMNSLIFMYGKCGCLDVSNRLLYEMPKRDRVSWSGLIAVYAEIGYSRKALQLYYQMVGQENILPDTSTVISTLSACAGSAFFTEGKELHNHITFLKLDADTEVTNCLINMYAKCGDLEDALALFASLPKKDTCSWNSMLTALLFHSHDIIAIDLFKRMQQEEVVPCDITFVSVLSACGNVASLIGGRIIHFMIACSEFESMRSVANALISMYGKCGSLKDALRQFSKLSARDTITWNAMSAAYAQHGCSEEALELLTMMQRERFPPDEVSFLMTISACSHTGLVDIGGYLWISMCQELKIKPGLEHFSCLLDAFSRAGRLFDAKQLIVNMPYQPCSASWTALLGACRDHANVYQGLKVADYLLEMDPLEFLSHSLNIDNAVSFWSDRKTFKLKNMQQFEDGLNLAVGLVQC
ncbi:hypothetical protein L7F22_013362 [Adiantum nelumboides]|nr:hypothetical protein [Adiantum nelumboides]